MKREILFTLLIAVATLASAQITIPLESFNIKEGKLIIKDVDHYIKIKGVDSDKHELRVSGKETHIPDAEATKLKNGAISINISTLNGLSKNVTVRKLDAENLGLAVNKLDGVIQLYPKPELKPKRSKSKGVYIISYSVEVPSGFSVLVKASSPNSEVEIEGIKGEVEVENEKAPTTLKNIFGPLVVSSDYGAISIQNFDKNCQSPVSVTSGTSNIQVYLPEEINADVRVNASKMNMDPDITWTMENLGSKKRNWFKAKLNNGGIPVHIQTGTGEITFRLR